MVTITLTDPEIQALAGLLDAGVRASGLRAARDAATILDKLEAAVAAAQPKPSTETTDAD